jgi:hypothetical protein
VAEDTDRRLRRQCEARVSNPLSTVGRSSTDRDLAHPDVWALRFGGRMGTVLGVLGGSGGVGASSFAAVAAAVRGGSVLIDLDVTGCGIDVTLGIEAAPGARWSGLRVAGGRLDPAALIDGLPRWGPVAVLGADVPELDPSAVLQVLEAASDAAPVVVDLPRAPCAERAAALLHCDLVVVLARADVEGLVAAHAQLAALPEVPIGLVTRRGEVSSRDAAALVGCPLLGEVPALGGSPLQLVPDRLPRALARVAEGVLGGLGGGIAGRHAASAA